MAGVKTASVFAGDLFDLFCLLGRRGNRLLDQNVKPSFETLDRQPVMQMRRCQDVDSIANPRIDQVGHIAEDRNAETIGKCLGRRNGGIADGRDFDRVGRAQRVRVPACDVARSDQANPKSRRRHWMILYLYSMMRICVWLSRRQ